LAGAERQPRILCAGIAVLDEVFRVRQVPAIDSKTDASAYISISGGCAANAAIAISRLGRRASIAGPLGDDKTADRILEGLVSEDIDCSGCVRGPVMSSSVSGILVNDAGERTIATYTDARLHSLVPRDAETLVKEADCLLIDNRRPNFVMPVCVAARERGIPVVMDADKPTRLDDPLLAIATHVIFSGECLKATTGVPDLEDGLRAAFARLRKFVAVTDGANDALWCDTGEIVKTPAFRISVVDTLAAGDTFHGAFALAMMEGHALPVAMRFAAAAAGLKCQKFGGSMTAPTRAEVEEFLRERAG
jgi:sugar/nucleoside kinase (ribokinase family)